MQAAAPGAPRRSGRHSRADDEADEGVLLLASVDTAEAAESAAAAEGRHRFGSDERRGRHRRFRAALLAAGTAVVVAGASVAIAVITEPRAPVPSAIADEVPRGSTEASPPEIGGESGAAGTPESADGSDDEAAWGSPVTPHRKAKTAPAPPVAPVRRAAATADHGPLVGDRRPAPQPPRPAPPPRQQPTPRPRHRRPAPPPLHHRPQHRLRHRQRRPPPRHRPPRPPTRRRLPLRRRPSSSQGGSQSSSSSPPPAEDPGPDPGTSNPAPVDPPTSNPPPPDPDPVPDPPGSTEPSTSDAAPPPADPPPADPPPAADPTRDLRDDDYLHDRYDGHDFDVAGAVTCTPERWRSTA